MKKLYYILTSLILLITNVSFGQGPLPTEYICKKPIITTTKTNYYPGDSLLLSFEIAETMASTNNTLLKYYNFYNPDFIPTSPVEFSSESSFSDVFVKEILEPRDTGWYYVQISQLGCPQTLDSIKVNIILHCSKPDITTTKTNYVPYEDLVLDFNIDENVGYSTTRVSTKYYRFLGPNGYATSSEEIPTNAVSLQDILAKSPIGNSDTGYYYVEISQTECPTTLDSIKVVFSDITPVCPAPYITTTDNILTLGETLKLEVLKIETIGTHPEPKILFTGPNNFRAGPWSWDSIPSYEFTLLNNFKAFNAGRYYATFITQGCNNISDFIDIVATYNPDYVSLPFLETFDSFRYNTLYPKWTFTGNINDQGLSRGYWHGTVSDYQSTYNCLIHNPGSVTSYKNDTIISPIFVNNIANDTTHLALKFDLASSIRKVLYGNEAKYDTLIINAYFNNSNTPITLRKISGFDLLTSGIPSKDSIYVPKVQTNSFFRTQYINLKNYDTCSTFRLHFIHKPTVNPASTSILLDNISILGEIEDTLMIPPSITADSVINFDSHFNLVLHFPEKSKIRNYTIQSRKKFSEKRILWGEKNLGLSQQSKIESFNFVEEFDLGNTQNDTTVTIPIRWIRNGVYEFQIKSIYSKFENNRLTMTPYYSNIIPVIISKKSIPIKKPILLVDSLYNSDRNFTLTLNVPDNHNAIGYQIYEDNNVIHYGLLGPTTDTNLVFNDTILIFNRTNISNGTRKYKAELLNPYKKDYHIFSDILNVTVDYNNIPLGIPQLSVDSINNKDKNFNLTISLPANNNGQEYGLIENNTTIQSIKITDNKSTVNKVISLTNKLNGTYTYTSYIKSGNRIAKSLPINVTVNYTIPPSLACTSEVVTASNRTKTNFTYSFKLNRNCSNTGYKALFYAGNNANGFLATNASLTQNQVERLSWTPTNGTPRNGVGTTGNIQLTQNEIKTGFFNRKVDTPLSFGNRWYRVDIVCTSCNQLNKTKTAYFFVTN